MRDNWNCANLWLVHARPISCRRQRMMGKKRRHFHLSRSQVKKSQQRSPISYHGVKNVLRESSFTSGANRYFSWLPLSGNLHSLVPPRACQITIHHHFGNQEESFKAFVNPEQKRILGERMMYDAFYVNGISPGAKLTLSHRGSDYHYDIRIKPVVVLSRRFWSTHRTQRSGSNRIPGCRRAA